MFRFADKEMPSPQEKGEDRATAAVLACGGTDGVPAFVLRHWRPGGGSTEPVFITWLLGVGRFCLTVKYGRYSLRGGGLAPRNRAGPPGRAVSAGAGPVRGVSGRRGPAAAAEPPGAGVAGPGPLRHEARPAHRAHRPSGWSAPALGPGALHRQAGRRGNRCSPAPIAGQEPGPGGDIRTGGGLRCRGRGTTPGRGAAGTIRTGVIGGASRRG